jgi:hypothetical protein
MRCLPYLHVDGDAGGLRGVRQGSEVGHPRRRRIGRFRAQGAERNPHIAERDPAGRGDDPQRVSHLLRVFVGHMVGDGRLHRDQAHAVRDDVVDLPGDAKALLVERHRGGQLGGAGRIRPPFPHRAPDRPANAENQRGEARLERRTGSVDESRCDQHHADQGHGGRASRVHDRAQRVEHQTHRHHRRRTGEVGNHAAGQAQHRDDDGGPGRDDRPSSPGGDRGGQGDPGHD